MDRWERGALWLALIALGVSLIGTSIVWHQQERHRMVIEQAQRGLVCLLQRAEDAAKAQLDQPAETRAVMFYEREIRLQGGRRADCESQ